MKKFLTAFFAMLGFAVNCPPQSALADEWDMSITPYIWLPEVKLGLGVGANPPVDSSQSILDILDGAFLIAGEARRGALSFFGEFNWLDLSDTIETRFGILDTDWSLNGIMVSANVGYAVRQTDNSRIEAFAGLRHWSLDAETSVVGRTARADRNWTDPIVGLRFEKSLSDTLAIRGMANVGGFGVGSEKQWELLGMVDWKVSDLVSVSAGYRHLDIDFDEDNLIWNTELSGPLLAVRFSF